MFDMNISNYVRVGFYFYRDILYTKEDFFPLIQRC